MKELTRYTNFDDLKSDKNRDKQRNIEETTKIEELEEFVSILKDNKLIKKNNPPHA